MKRRGLVIFDGDDTLWSVEELYDRALSIAATAVGAAGLPEREWLSLQREIDLCNVQQMGVSRDRFPLSSMQALDQLSVREGLSATEKLRDAVLSASQSVFAMKAPVIEDAAPTLAALAPLYKLVLLTKGDEEIQIQRIEESRLASWFDRIDIVADKTEESFERIAVELGTSPTETWSVGNSLASDVYPALRVGMSAVWIDAHVWEHERREAFAEHPKLLRLEHLAELVPALARSSIARSS